MKRRKKKYDYMGYPVLTFKQIERLAENMIPQKFRPYYVGADIMAQDPLQETTAWNCDIELLFKYPVVSNAVDGVRYAHASLEDMRDELRNLSFDNDSNTDEWAEYDEGVEGRAVVEIRPMRKRIAWRQRRECME